MTDSGPLISAAFLSGLDECLARKYGVELEPVLVDLQIAVRPPYEKAPRFELRKFAELLEVLSHRTGEPCFGLAFAESFSRGAGGVLSYLIMNAPDLRSFMKCLSRYSRLQIEAVDLTYREADGLLQFVTWSFSSDFISARRQLTEFLMALFVVRTQQLFGRDLKPMAVEFEYREPACRARYEGLFGPNLKFGAATNTMTTRAVSMSRPALESDKKLFDLLEGLAEKQLQELGNRPDIKARVGREIVAGLPIDGIELDRIATALGMSSRQLQSQLKRSGTSFEAEMARIRMSLAERYLRDTDMSMTDIALMLGFSELSSFTRAARNWFHKPPTTVREEAREGKLSKR